MANSFNEIGENAENIVSLLLNRKLKSELFRVKFLGEKWPAVDFYVELVNNNGFYFFVQVKSSTRGYFIKGGKKTHLKVTVKKKSVMHNLEYNAPTYLIGLEYRRDDFFKSKAFIHCLSGNPASAKSISKIAVTNSLNPTTLALLEKEVLRFWSTSNSISNKHSFVSKFV